jgi:hypothetical protein
MFYELIVIIRSVEKYTVVMPGKYLGAAFKILLI